MQSAVDKLTVNIVPGKGYDRHYNEIIVDRIHSGFDSDVKVNFVEVNRIDRETSGKLRVIKRQFD